MMSVNDHIQHNVLLILQPIILNIAETTDLFVLVVGVPFIAVRAFWSEFVRSSDPTSRSNVICKH